jgi:hypothetical protein
MEVVYDAPVPEVHSIGIARQPFTFGGVARFASAHIVRVVFVGLIFGCVSGLVVCWLAAARLAPVIDEAVSKLPPTGSIEGGRLNWPAKNGGLLAANAFVSFEVKVDDTRAEGAPADFAFRFDTNHLAVTSIFGTARVEYPASLELELNRTALVPTWGAWRAPLLFGLIPATILVLLCTWGMLATVYSVLPILIGGAFNRALGFRGAWKLSVAAQWPASLMMAFALALYSSGQIALIFVLAMLVAHFIPTLVYLLFSPLFVPKAREGSANPFTTDERRREKRKNPFAGK